MSPTSQYGTRGLCWWLLLLLLLLLPLLLLLLLLGRTGLGGCGGTKSRARLDLRALRLGASSAFLAVGGVDGLGAKVTVRARLPAVAMGPSGPTR